MGKRFASTCIAVVNVFESFNPKEMDYLEIQELKQELNKERQEQVWIYSSILLLINLMYGPV